MANIVKIHVALLRESICPPLGFIANQFKKGSFAMDRIHETRIFDFADGELANFYVLRLAIVEFGLSFLMHTQSAPPLYLG